MKHTAGEWVVKHSESKPAFNVIGTMAGQKYKIARCPYFVLEDNAALTKRHKDEAEADAKLISAAPDLLTVLRLIVGKMVLERTEEFDLLRETEAVIKKATE